MKRFIALVFGAAIAAAGADFAALSAPPDWSENGRWLTQYVIPGYSGGYAVTWPGAQQTAAKPAK